MNDPFSAEADPRRLDGSAPPAVTWSERKLGRRLVVSALVAVPSALVGSACIRTSPACPTLPASAQHCRHRFCRYHHDR